LISGGLDSTIIEWDFSKHKVLNQIDLGKKEKGETHIINPPFVHCISLTTWSDAKASKEYVAAALGDFTVIVFEILRRGEITHYLKAHTGAVSQVRWIETDQNLYLVSGGNDGNIFVWHIAEYSPKTQQTQTSQNSTSSGATGKQKNPQRMGASETVERETRKGKGKGKGKEPDFGQAQIREEALLTKTEKDTKLQIHHNSKINWLLSTTTKHSSSATTSATIETCSLFVADQTPHITIYELHLKRNSEVSSCDTLTTSNKSSTLL